MEKEALSPQNFLAASPSIELEFLGNTSQPMTISVD